ncbi:LysR family transcriptional regulator [Pandoraea cepalis]|uniref:LysR family transcriptional regulator n=1 Tax=Pandoraea cepalis TaxID=2508294 RepID=A0AAW7MNW3_9BURK|nr:LysR family transcriptional regulator [Pandoraea cepalis]MDN4574241.1 LysR family transcriptional regulator [Pandoraea cepalis]MDN4579744.1 LysR family transcriptional regulator [Pandoraea cepalis]
MDRIDAMKVFVAIVDEGSLAGAARRLGRSAAAVSRAIGYLEAHTGTALLHRTTRSVKLSVAGERYAAACRRILLDLDEADVIAAGERSAPRGLLTVSAPLAAGETFMREIVDAFIERYPEVVVRLQLSDLPVSLIDEGIDVAMRVAHLPDSSLVATHVGEVRRIIAASPAYLATHDPIGSPADLSKQQIVSMTYFGIDSWRFPATGRGSVPQIVQFTPRLVVNSIRAAIASVVAGHGVARMLTYHIVDEMAHGTLRIVLQDYEHPPMPVHVITPQGRLAVPKVRAFVDFAVPRLRKHFARVHKLASQA